MICSANISDERLVDAYLAARNTVINKGYGHEIQWQYGRGLERLSESDFLRESAWVVLASGMSDLIVRRKFPAVSAAFCWWQSAGSIVRDEQLCRSQAMSIFGHKGKISAIITIAATIHDLGFPQVRRKLNEEAVGFIQSLPYMGPATSFHLAKNIGLNVAKPDRHLCRMSAAAGYDTPCDMCQRISKYVADTVPVIDIVLWRYATIERSYVKRFSA
jgi:hypothetical protein